MNVSVVIPAYNAERHLADAVRSALGQSVTPNEVLIVDDGSDDTTGAIAQGFGARVRYVRQSNQGVAAARNRGIELATSDLIAFLDADDQWMPSKLAVQLGALNETGAHVCYSDLSLIDSGGQEIGVHQQPPHYDIGNALFYAGNVVGTPSSVVVSREALASSGGFRPDLSFSADWDLWIRLARAHRFVHVRQPLVRYRVHSSNMSRNTVVLERDSIRMLTDAIADPFTPDPIRRDRKLILSRQWSVIAGCHREAGNLRSAIRSGLRSIALHPQSTPSVIGRAVNGRTAHTSI